MLVRFVNGNSRCKYATIYIYDILFTADTYWSDTSPDWCPRQSNYDYKMITHLCDCSMGNSTCYTADEQVGPVLTSGSASPVYQVYLAGQARGAYHLAIVIAQAVHVTSCRVRRVSLLQHGLFTNWRLFVAVAIEVKSTRSLIILVHTQIVLIGIIVYAPGVQYIMQTAALPWPSALLPGLLAGAVLAAYNIAKQAYCSRQPHTRLARAINW
jgi:hypothetical protein